MHYSVGNIVPRLRLVSILGAEVSVPSSRHSFTHLQFRRYAGCPVCNLHVRTVASRIGEIEKYSVSEVAVFNATIDEMLPFQGDLPFTVIADPDRKLYDLFDVKMSPLSILHPAVLMPYLKGVAADHPSGTFKGDSGGHLGLPADFLIGPSGKVLAVKYGRHAADNWSVDELLRLSRGGGATPSTV